MSRPTGRETFVPAIPVGGRMLKKVIALAAVAAAGFAVYSRMTGAREERDLWNEATSAPDLR